MCVMPLWIVLKSSSGKEDDCEGSMCDAGNFVGDD